LRNWEARERGLRRNQTCQHFDFVLQSPGLGELNPYCVILPICSIVSSQLQQTMLPYNQHILWLAKYRSYLIEMKTKSTSFHWTTEIFQIFSELPTIQRDSWLAPQTQLPPKDVHVTNPPVVFMATVWSYPTVWHLRPSWCGSPHSMVPQLTIFPTVVLYPTHPSPHAKMNSQPSAILDCSFLLPLLCCPAHIPCHCLTSVPLSSSVFPWHHGKPSWWSLSQQDLGSITVVTHELHGVMDTSVFFPFAYLKLFY
jgi:hypothetical protein